MSKKHFKSIFLLLLLVAFSANAIGQVNERKALERQRKALIQEIKRTNGLVLKNKKTLSANLSSYKLLKSKKRKIEKVVQTIEREKQIVHQLILKLNTQISQQKNQLQKLKASYAKGVVSSYKNQKALNPLTFLLTSDSFNSALRKITFLRKVNSYRNQQAQSIHKLIKELEQTRQNQIKERESKNKLLQEQKTVQEDLKKSEKELAQTIQSLKEKKGELTVLLKKQQSERNALQAEIKNLIAKEIAKKKAAEAKKKTKVEESAPVRAKKENKSKEYSATPVAKKLSNQFAQNKGKLPWPLEKGVVVGSMGQYSDDVLPGIKRERDGVDIRTEKGASVKAIFDGKVISRTTIPGFNKVVILSHGKYFTVYGRLQDIDVQVGDAVKVGDRLGTLEEKDGVSELHLQLWHKQEKLNPKNWLKK